MQVQMKPMSERRKQAPDQSIWWDKLSLAQKFSASSLAGFGYELIFIRTENSRRLAVLKCNNTIAVILEDGEIDTSPTIILR